jgi:hypothetical protein
MGASIERRHASRSSNPTSQGPRSEGGQRNLALYYLSPAEQRLKLGAGDLVALAEQVGDGGD